MNVRIIVTENFAREAKKLLKKHKSLKADLNKLRKSLEKDPYQGIQIRDNVYKIRVAIRSKGKGKSGGARVITFLIIGDTTPTDFGTEVYLLSIYDKSSVSNIPSKKLDALIKMVITEEEE